MSWNFPYDSPNAIIELLDEKGLAMTKKFGQNFLLSKDVRQRIVALMELEENTKVWEIGPGIGAITSLIIDSKADLTSFEIDHGFCRILEQDAFKDDDNFTLIEGDALKTWKNEFDKEGVPEVICGNLPYNVGSVCIAKLLENSCHPKKMVFTLQKEVAQRLCATAGSKLWSSFSVLAQIDYFTSLAMDINNGAFYPVPKVVSSVILMQKREKSLVNEEIRATFLMLVRDLFSKRRKTIKNNLVSGKVGKLIEKEILIKALDESGISPSIRAEKMEIKDFIKLASVIDKVLKNN